MYPVPLPRVAPRFDYCLQLVDSFVLNPSDLRKPTKHLLWRWFFPAKPQFLVTKFFSMTSVHSHWSRSPDPSLPMDQLAIALWCHPVKLLSLSHLGLMGQVSFSWDNFILISIAKLHRLLVVNTFLVLGMHTRSGEGFLVSQQIEKTL